MTLPELRKRAKRALRHHQASKTATISLRADMQTYLSEASAIELARKLKITPQYLSDIRNGRRELNGALIEALAGLEG